MRAQQPPLMFLEWHNSEVSVVLLARRLKLYLLPQAWYSKICEPARALAVPTPLFFPSNAFFLISCASHGYTWNINIAEHEDLTFRAILTSCCSEVLACFRHHPRVRFLKTGIWVSFV